MPTLNWIGKEKVINHHLDVPFHTLNEEYSFGEQSENKIIHADNLLALKSLLPEYEGRIKCIYIDPPYNTGNEGWVYNDNVNDPKIKKWLGQVVGKEAEDLTRHDKWLCMMYPRLKLLHKLLSDDGAIFISIDDNEQANLKLLCDEIFGSANFVATFYWKRTSTPPSLSNTVRKKFEPLFCYQKSSTQKFFNGGNSGGGDMPLLNAGNALVSLKFKKESVVFKIPNGFYEAKRYNKVNLLTDVNIQDGRAIEDFILEGNFKWTQQTLDKEVEEETIFFIKSSNFSIRYMRDGIRIKTPSNIISKEECNVETNEDAAKLIESIFNEKTFSFPKPVSLVEYLINFLADKNSIILDSFAGSGTTAHAILNLNKQDGGNRKFILVEMENYAETITAERVKRVMNGYAETEGTGGGFTYYTLGETVLDEEHNLNAKLALHKIHQYIWYAETHAPYTAKATSEGYLGKFNETGIYFHYTPDEVTTLDDAYLMHVKQKAEQYIIYADMCLLSDKFLLKHNIIFKKIPRDISKL